MGIFLIISNIVLMIVVALGIYGFSNSFLWAGIGAFIISSASSQNPLYALFAYPVVEYFFNDGHLTIFSVITVGVTLLQFIAMFIMARREM